MAANAPGADPLLGKVLAGSYRLEEWLGRGAMGTVYRASHTLFKQSFAVKVLHPELAEDDDVRRRFLQEAQALALFTHKNAVPVRHCGAEQGLVFLAMDLCRGETLESVLAREKALPEARVIDIGLQVLGALDEAHRGGIVHRDLKPANVMVEPKPGGGELARVLDFGLARILAAGRDGVTSRVSTLGEVVGTVAYMSPQQALGQDLDGQSDLFSLGVMLFEMVEGRHPFLGGSMASVITRVLEADPLAPEPATPRKASEGFARVLGHALQKDVAHRYPDAASFAQALRDLGAGREIEKPFDARGEARARARRRRWAGVGAGLVLVAAWAWGFSLLRSDPEEEAEALAATARATAHEALALGRWREVALALEPLVASGGASLEDRLTLVEARIALLDADADRDLSALERSLPGDARVSLLRGRYFHKVKGDPERALEAYSSALARNRHSVEVREARLDLLLDRAHAPWFEARHENRVAQAGVDVAALRDIGAPAGRAELAESRVLRMRAAGEGAEGVTTLDEALQHARRASADEPASIDGPIEEFFVLLELVGRAREAGQPQRAVTLASEAVVRTTEALRRLKADPTHRAQGAREVEVLRWRSHASMRSGDAELLAADARRMHELGPGEPAALLEAAYALRTAGSFEEALPLYETLAELIPEGRVLGDLAFVHQRLALIRLQAGGKAEGTAQLRRAVAAYDRVLTFRSSAVFLAYRAETRLMLARWVPEERAEQLAAARKDVDEARATALEGEVLEVQFRRTWVLFAQGDLEGAHAEIAAAVFGKPALNPSFHGRLAVCALALGCRALAGGDAFAAARHRQQALDELNEAEARSGEAIGSARLLKGQARLLLDPLGTDREAATDLAMAADEKAMPTADQQTEAKAWGALAHMRVNGAPEARRTVEALLSTRRTELASGRDAPTAAFEVGLAELLEGAGQAELGGLLRQVAARRPPP